MCFVILSLFCNYQQLATNPMTALITALYRRQSSLLVHIDSIKTNMNSTIQDIFENEFGLSATTLTLDLIEFCSSFVFILIIHFEKYGGDPQKRTLVNQLTSYICALLFLFLVTKNIAMSTRVVFGCFHLYLGYSVNISASILVVCIIMFILDIFIYKFFKVFAYRLVVNLNEDNCAFFLSIINPVVSVSIKVFSFVKMGNPHLNPYRLKVLTCEENVTARPG